MVVTGAEWKSPVDPGDRGFCQTEVRGTCVFAVDAQARDVLAILCPSAVGTK
jgi:hypothetical protein